MFNWTRELLWSVPDFPPGATCFAGKLGVFAGRAGLCCAVRFALRSWGGNPGPVAVSTIRPSRALSRIGNMRDDPISSIFDFKYEDFTLVDYDPYPAIPAPIAI